MMSTGLQSLVVAALFILGITKPGQQLMKKTYSLVMPVDVDNTPQAPPKKNVMQGGGGRWRPFGPAREFRQAAEGGAEAVHAAGSVCTTTWPRSS